MSRHIKPHYVHTACDSCEFIGSYNGFDLYYCARSDSDMGGTVIARYGNDGSNYASHGCSLAGMYSLGSEHMKADGMDAMRALRVALLIAFDMGLTGKYKDNQSKGYRVLKFDRPDMWDLMTMSPTIDNEQKAYREAYSEDDGSYVEIVKVISSNADEF